MGATSWRQLGWNLTFDLREDPIASLGHYNRCTRVSLEATSMTNVSKILSAIEQGDDQAAEQLLPLVYDELRRLAAQKLRHEKPGQTLSATALVHEAYVRLVDTEQVRNWNDRGHFFAAAAEAMRRILIESARRKQPLKRGGNLGREGLKEAEIAVPEAAVDVIVLDEAINRLAETDLEAAEVVKLRFFAGLTITEAAAIIEVSPRRADSLWAYARAWLFAELGGE